MLAGFVIPRWAWVAMALLALLVGLRVWFVHEVSTARREGAAEQARVDREAYAAAEGVATARQAALRAKVKARADAISKETSDALDDRRIDLARGYDDLRMRWAAYRADQGRAGQGGPTGLAGAASVADDAYCKAQGWVSLHVATAAAEAADGAILKDDQWIEWQTNQMAAWPD